MNKTIFAIAGAAAILLSLMTSKAYAEAQTICGERADFVKKLKDGYAEKPISLGLAANGSAIEVFTADSGTFSIIITQPNGVSCLIASGQEWLELPQQKVEIGI